MDTETDIERDMEMDKETDMEIETNMEMEMDMERETDNTQIKTWAWKYGTSAKYLVCHIWMASDTSRAISNGATVKSGNIVMCH